MSGWRNRRVRVLDSKGSGLFAATRGPRRHEGVDYLFSPGEEVESPIEGIVTRLGWCYMDEPYRLIEILSRKGHFLYRLLYVDPNVKAGQVVRKGQIIGQAQDIASKYGGEGKMQNHVHVEININPMIVIGGRDGD